MICDKLNLMIHNCHDLDKVHGTFGMSLFKKCNALNVTLKDKNVDAEKINMAINLIKGKTSIFSNFRGNNLLTLAVNISLTDNMEASLEEIINIYNKLKEQFFSNQYLVLAAQVIFDAKDRVNTHDAIINTRTVYNLMKNNHRFLTGHEDIACAAMIATTSKNYDETFNEIEKCYTILKKHGLWSGNNLQTLSHVLCFINLPAEDKCKKVVELKEKLETYNVPLKSYSLPLLGIASFVTDDTDAFAKTVVTTSNELKKEKGFGTISMGALIRNMISASLVTSMYIDTMDEVIKDNLINTTNNVALTVAIAIEIATMAAVSSAAAASSASN